RSAGHPSRLQEAQGLGCSGHRRRAAPGRARLHRLLRAPEVGRRRAPRVQPAPEMRRLALVAVLLLAVKRHHPPAPSPSPSPRPTAIPASASSAKTIEMNEKIVAANTAMSEARWKD